MHVEQNALRKEKGRKEGDCHETVCMCVRACVRGAGRTFFIMGATTEGGKLPEGKRKNGTEKKNGGKIKDGSR